jgi:site-specific recombinase XerD
LREKRHPAELGEAEGGQFLSALAMEQRVSAATQNQALNALGFLYRHVLKLDVGQIEHLVRAKHSQRLPVALRTHEVNALLDG